MKHEPVDNFRMPVNTPATPVARPKPAEHQVSPGVFDVGGKYETRNPDHPMGEPVKKKPASASYEGYTDRLCDRMARLGWEMDGEE